DNEDPDLEFILSELANGQVEVELTPGNWTVATNFTQQLVADGNVRFVLNKESRYAPSYYVSVYDGELYTDPEAVSVIFNNPSLISGTSEQLVTSSITYDKQNVAAILGAVIGGGVLLCVAIGGGILCYRRSHANTSDEVALSDISPRAESHKRMISMMVQDGQINMELAIPFSELTLGEKIGGGGSGIVHEGTWHGTKVAVKHLLFVDFDERAMREFLREVTMMANLRHPNIVEFYKVCIEPEKNCIVMEYMAGGSLYDLLHSEGELEWVLRLQFALEICQGLKYLHHNNIVHRDLKSLNVLLDERQQHAKLTDFGLSKQDTGTATMTKAIGTPAWMPPEALNDERYTPKSDIYSYGIILHELATREDPYPGIKNVTIMQEVLKGRRPVLPAKCPCPSRFSLLMQRCWAGRPDERPDAITVAQELKEQQELGDTTWHAASIQTI
ncbi:MAG TPA: protein kinase, partial [Methanosarcinales archaeon]|nr:protein kinase [Methanosarcinales archaeon]